MNSGFRELLRLFRSHKVRYLVVGGYAVMKYTEPRYTMDLDLWIDTSLLNARRVYKALSEFGAPIEGYTPEDFTSSGMVHQIGIPPSRIDILTSISGLKFDSAWPRRRRARVGGEFLFFASLEDLIKSKKKTGRLQDKLDVSNLELARARNQNAKTR